VILDMALLKITVLDARVMKTLPVEPIPVYLVLWAVVLVLVLHFVLLVTLDMVLMKIVVQNA
jgi:hypothetical protein